MEKIISNPEKYYKDDSKFNKYLFNIFNTLSEQYHDNDRLNYHCRNFYYNLDCSAIKEARGYGVSYRMFQPTSDRLQFHIGNMDENIKYKCCFDHHSWYIDGYEIYEKKPWRFERYHSDKEMKEHLKYALEIAKLFKENGLKVIILNYDVNGKGYLGVNVKNESDVRIDDSILFFVYI